MKNIWVNVTGLFGTMFVVLLGALCGSLRAGASQLEQTCLAVIEREYAAIVGTQRAELMAQLREDPRLAAFRPSYAPDHAAECRVGIRAAIEAWLQGHSEILPLPGGAPGSGLVPPAAAAARTPGPLHARWTVLMPELHVRPIEVYQVGTVPFSQGKPLRLEATKGCFEHLFSNGQIIVTLVGGRHMFEEGGPSVTPEGLISVVRRTPCEADEPPRGLQSAMLQLSGCLQAMGGFLERLCSQRPPADAQRDAAEQSLMALAPFGFFLEHSTKKRLLAARENHAVRYDYKKSVYPHFILYPEDHRALKGGSSVEIIVSPDWIELADWRCRPGGASIPEALQLLYDALSTYDESDGKVIQAALQDPNYLCVVLSPTNARGEQYVRLFVWRAALELQRSVPQAPGGGSVRLPVIAPCPTWGPLLPPTKPLLKRTKELMMLNAPQDLPRRTVIQRQLSHRVGAYRRHVIDLCRSSGPTSNGLC